MRRPAVFVFLTAAALALVGCDGASSGDWSEKAESSGRATTPSASATADSALATCLEGTWVVDEAVLTSTFRAGFVEGLAEEEGTAAEITALTASQSVTFADDLTFTSETQMDGAISVTVQGQSVPMEMKVTTSANGTWKVVDDEMAITPLAGEGTMTMTALGQTQTDDLSEDARDVVMLPTVLEPVTCSGSTLTLDGTGLSMLVPDAPDQIVFTRQ